MHAMRILKALIFVLAASMAGEALADDCKLQQIASLDMTVTKDGRILIPISLDDTPRLVVPDTGGVVGMLGNGIPAELGLKATPIRGGEVYVGSGQKPTHFVTIPSLKIGPDEAKYTEFILVDWADDAEHSVGTVGGDILRNFDIDIDFAANKFNLFSQDHCDGKVVYWARSYTDADVQIDHHAHITVTMSLDGHDVEALIDTGTNVTMVSETFAKRTFGIDASSPGVETIPDGSGILHRYKFKSLSVSGLSMPDPEIVIMPDVMAQQSQADINARKMQGHEDAVEGPSLILGTDVLRHLHIYIAYKEKKIYVTAAGAH
jgi:aspartyl protease